MTLWFLRGLRRGVVTTRYPREAEPSTTCLPSPPMFRAELLSIELADLLVRRCPSTALWREDDTLVYDIGRCTGCQLCLEVAGSAARPSRVVELAAISRRDLVRRIVIGGDDER